MAKTTRLCALTSLLFASSRGFPSFPGTCSSPNPLGAFHVEPGFNGGTALSDFGLEVLIGDNNNNPLDPSTPYTLTVDKEHTIELRAAAGNAFRGFLIKIYKDGVDSTTWLSNDSEDIQRLHLCNNIKAGSMAHRNRNDKLSIIGTLSVDEVVDDVTMEVTVVIINQRNEESEWYQSIYTLNVKEETTSTIAGLCFPGNALVHSQDRGLVAMKHLQLGDVVMTDGDTFEPIYSFGHFDRKASAEFVQLKTTTGKTLELSKSHMVLVPGNRAVPARSIQIGDSLMTAFGDEAVVMAIKTVVRKGVFAPFTPSGSIVINGIKASNYISFQDSHVLKIGSFDTGVTYQWMAHAFELPHRFWCHYLGASSSCKDEQYIDGISAWVSIPHQVSRWFVKQNAIVMTVVSVPLLLILGLFWTVDVFLLAYPFKTVLLLLLTATLVIRLFSIRIKKKKKSNA